MPVRIRVDSRYSRAWIPNVCSLVLAYEKGTLSVSNFARRLHLSPARSGVGNRGWWNGGF